MPDNKIKSLSLENYKAFTDDQKLPIKKINLIFGHNSSGKSSLIESLSLIKETYLNSKITSFATRGQYKIPTYREIISDGDLKKNLVIKTEVDWKNKTESSTSPDFTNNLPKNLDEYQNFNIARKGEYQFGSAYAQEKIKIAKYFTWNKNRVRISKIDLIPSDDNEKLKKNKDDKYNKILTFELRKLKAEDRANFADPSLNLKDSNSQVGKIDKSSVNYNHPYWNSIKQLLNNKYFYQKFIFNIIRAIDSHPLDDYSLYRARGQDYQPSDKTEHYYKFFIDKFNIKLKKRKFLKPTINPARTPKEKREYLIYDDYDDLINFGELFIDDDSKIWQSGIGSLIDYRRYGRRVGRRRNYLDLASFGNDKIYYEILEYAQKGKDVSKILIDEYLNDLIVLFQGITVKKVQRYSILSKINDLRTEYFRTRIILSNQERFNFYASLLNLKTPCRSLIRGDQVEGEYFYKTIPLGVDRPEALSVYEYSGSTPENVGPFAQNIPDILYQNKEKLDTRLNYWLKEIGINFEVKVKKNISNDSFEVKIWDKGREDTKKKNKKVIINFKEAGTGVKSILPIILNSITTNKTLLTIQEPERSLHPKFQIKLADMFVEMSQTRENSFFIETHSEYLVYRFMKLVRDGRISKDDLSFNYVVKTQHGSKIVNLRMNDDGDFIDEWPEGFFSERIEMLME